MSSHSEQSSVPRAMVHKRILDYAESNPDAAIEAIAENVSSASPSLVERVLEEYGDPAASDGGPEDDTDSTTPESAEEDSTTPTVETESADTDEAQPPMDSNATTNGQEVSDGDGPAVENSREGMPELAELDEKQRQILEAIRERPDATQERLAERFDVTRATVSRWVNSVPGFDWQDRSAFVAELFDEEPVKGDTDEDDSETADDGANEKQNGTGSSHQDREPDADADVAALAEGLDAVADRPEDDGRTDDPLTSDPELAHKVIHACLRSERITEEEELRLLKWLLES
ncbi:MAG: winged helix-turn-helix transcriptional regulator [Haloarculaceae archaeon]